MRPEDVQRVAANEEPGDNATPDARTKLENLTQSIRNRLLAIYRTGDISDMAPFSSQPESMTKAARAEPSKTENDLRRHRLNARHALMLLH